MKRVLSLVLALVIVLGTMPMAFAADQTAGEMLKAAGFVQGDENGNLMEDKGLSRAELAVLVAELNGVKENAKAYAIAPEFNDVQANDWFAPYVAYAAKEGWFKGDELGNFNPKGDVSSQMIATVMLRALGYDPAWTTAVAEAQAMGLPVGAADAMAMKRAEAFVTMWGVVNTPKKGSDVALGVELGKLETVVTGALAIDSVEALKVNQLEVKFNKEVDTKDVTLTVKRGNTAVAVDKTEWNEAMTVATLSTTAKMINGTHTVTVKSAADADFEAIGTTEIVSQYVKEIVINDDVALAATSTRAGAKDNDTIFVFYDVLDQYGESIRTSTSVEFSSSASKIATDRTTGKITFAKNASNDSFVYGEKVYVTGVYTKTGLTVNKTVEVGQKQQLDSIKLAGYLKKGTSEIVKELPAGFSSETYYMLYTMYDQNGNEYEASTAGALTGNPLQDNLITFVSDNVLVIKEVLKSSVADPNNETTLVIDGTEYHAAFVEPGIDVDKGGEVNLTAISNKTGNKTAINTAVGANSILTTFTMSEPSSIIADGESVELPFVALDQNGERITNFRTLAKNETFNTLSFSTSPGIVELYENNDGTATLEYTDASAGAARIDWTDSESTDGIDRPVNVTAVVTGGEGSNLMLYIVDKARPEGIAKVDFESTLIERGTDKLTLSSFDFIDQYGRNMTTEEDEAWTAVTDSNTDNDNDGAIYDNGFFAAAYAGTLNGTEFSTYRFAVRAQYKGDANMLAVTGASAGFAAGNVAADAKFEIHAVNGAAANEVLAYAANSGAVSNIGSSKSGLSMKFDIVKYKTTGTFAADAQAVSPAKSESLTIADINAVKGYVVKDLDKFYLATVKKDDNTGDSGVLALGNATTTGGATAVATVAIDSVLTGADFPNTAGASLVDAIDLAHRQTVEVTGTFNGKTVDVPAAYFNVTGDHLSTGGAAGVAGAGTVIVKDATAAVKWSDFYDSSTSRYVRKDGKDTLKVTIFDLDTAGTPVVDTVSKAVLMADGAPEATTIAVHEDEESNIGKATVRDGNATAITAHVVAGSLIDLKYDGGVDRFVVEDQYGVAYPTAAVTFKVASIVENAEGYAQNNFTVSGNDTIAASMTGVERGDTYVLTIKADDAELDVNVTVGADDQANVTNLANNYLTNLIGTETNGLLENQRLDGLN